MYADLLVLQTGKGPEAIVPSIFLIISYRPDIIAYNSKSILFSFTRTDIPFGPGHLKHYIQVASIGKAKTKMSTYSSCRI